MAAIAGTAPYFVPANAFAAPGRSGANDRLRIGIIGIGIRGRQLISNLPAGGQVVALCDCATSRVADAMNPNKKYDIPLEKFREQDAERCAVYQDYRQMLEREPLDAVMVATPHHHHAQCVVLACQAGLDVYVEKPLTLTIAEGRAIVRAVQKYERVLQVGSQQRTMEMNRFPCEFVRDGGIGKVSRVELPCYPGPLRYEGLPAEAVPRTLDWDLFCGPTEFRPHNRKLWVKDVFKINGKLWRGWDKWRSYSGHLMTNFAAHTVDMVQYALGMDGSGPVEIWPMTEGHTGDMQTCPVAMRYANGTLLQFLPTATNAVFHGERGKLFLRRNWFRTDPPELVTNPPDPKLAERWRGPGWVARPHIKNWLDCMRSRQLPNAPAEVGHRSATVCNLAGIARELRRRLHWNPIEERFAGDDEANQLLGRPRRNGFELPTIG